MYPVNPIQLIQMIKQGQNPQQLLMSIMQGQAGNNPVMQNLLSMAQKNDVKALEQFARNLLASQGKDYDAEFTAFRQQTGL